MKNKKGQIEQLTNLIIPLIGVGIVLVVGFLIMSEAKDQVLQKENEQGNFCISGYVLNTTDTDWQCCNDTSPMNCGAGNTTGMRMPHSWNGTLATQEAMSDIPGWLPIIVITVIGALLIGLVAIFRSQ